MTKTNEIELVVCPTINLNGTSADALIEQYAKAATAVADAIKAVAEAWPHGRDFQTMKPCAHRRATEQHDDRMAWLRSVHADLMVILDNVCEQKLRREEDRRRS